MSIFIFILEVFYSQVKSTNHRYLFCEANILILNYPTKFLGSMPLRMTSCHLRLRLITPSHMRTLKIENEKNEKRVAWLEPNCFIRSCSLKKPMLLIKGYLNSSLSNFLPYEIWSETSINHVIGDRGKVRISLTHMQCIVEPSLTDTSRQRTLPISGRQTVVPAISSLKHYIFNLP